MGGWFVGDGVVACVIHPRPPSAFHEPKLVCGTFAGFGPPWKGGGTGRLGTRGLVKGEEVGGVADIAGVDAGGVCNADGMEFAFEFAVPEIEEFLEDRETRGEVEVLPDVGLQQAGVVGEVVEDLGGGEAVVP